MQERSVRCTMKILVLSDSHSSLRFMRECIKVIKPDCMIHLGDYAQDGQVIRSENPQMLFFQVSGNCDGFVGRTPADSTLLCEVEGVKLLLTHGHRYQVKTGLDKLIAYAREMGVDGVLFGHTHEALCWHETDGLWILNPGAAGFWGGSAGLIEVGDGKITACRIIGQAALETMV